MLFTDELVFVLDAASAAGLFARCANIDSVSFIRDKQWWPHPRRPCKPLGRRALVRLLIVKETVVGERSC